MDRVEEIAAGVREGRLDPVALVEGALGRAQELAGLNAVVHLDAEGARSAAARHSRVGALAGVPVLVKEIVEVAGLPFRCGSASMAEIGRRDADVVRRLRAAGAIVVGLSHSHEFAYGCTGTSNRVGPGRNPHDLSRMTGGSSSGAAAAVAAGIVPLAIGTDTAGSVRIPAALCGVVGFKPAYDTLPRDGVFPLAQSLDHVGVLTSTVADAAYALRCLTGDSHDFTGTTKPPRLGVVSNDEYLAFTDEVGEAWSRALACLRRAGATIDEVRLPDWKTTFQAAGDLQGPEAFANHQGRPVNLYQPDVQQRLREAAEITPARHEQAKAIAHAAHQEMQNLLTTVDAVLTPTVLTTAPPIETLSTPEGSRAIRAQLLTNTRLANLTRHPAISIPIPTPGLPAALQVIAGNNHETTTTARWIESHLGRWL